MNPRRRKASERTPVDERAQDHVRDDLAEDLPDEDLDPERTRVDDDDDEDLGRPIPLER